MSDRLTSSVELAACREKLRAAHDPSRLCVTVCCGTGCRANRGLEVAEALRKACRQSQLGDKVSVRATGCLGFCEKGPVVTVRPQGLFYTMVKPADAQEIVDKTLVRGEPVERLFVKNGKSGPPLRTKNDIPFYKNQQPLIFDIKIDRGGGAFVCGEETGLMASIEGGVGEPRPRCVYPAERGLWSRPTVINNVETWANVPHITLKGANWLSALGTKTSKGTKIFSLVGKVNNTGLVEVPMGATLRQIIYDIGGGIENGKKFKGVQTGGPSGGVLAERHLDLPIDYDQLVAVGSIPS